MEEATYDLVMREAHLDQYIGPWAMAETSFLALAERARTLDLSLHMVTQSAKRSAESEFDPLAFGIRDGIAMIDLQGTLMKHASSFGGGTSTAVVRKQIGRASRDDSVKAILLNIDSPGGTVAGTKELGDLVAATSKPIIAFIEDLGASAAYWVASQADAIFSNATAQIGSIGTFGIVHDLSANAAQNGIKVHVLSTGKFKGAFVPGTEVSAEMLQEEQRIVDELNEFFLSAVAKGRSLSKAAVRELADGRTHIGETAQTIGLIDGVKTFEQAFKFTKKTTTATPSRRTKAMTTQVSDPASYDELAAACLGADDSFIVDQLRRHNSVEQAQQDWMTEQQLRIEQRDNELAAAVAREAAVTEAATIASIGVAPAPASDVEASGGEHGTAFHEWNDIIKQNIQAGLTRQKAVRKAARDNHELRETMIAEYNVTHAHMKNNKRKS